jgi:hypothetical protein
MATRSAATNAATREPSARLLLGRSPLGKASDAGSVGSDLPSRFPSARSDQPPIH